MSPIDERSHCRRLRSKGMFVEAAPDPSVPDTNDVFFWCTHTMNCLGPDGKVAGPEHCHPARRCFQGL